MPPRQAGLSKEKIVATAIDLLEAGGAEGLSMRKLATAMGVVPMAFYNHFEDRDALLDAVAEHVLQALVPAAANRSWRSRLASLFREIRKLRTQYPQAFRLAMSRPTHAKTVANLVGSVMEGLRDAGLDEKDAVMCYHTFLVFLRGFPIWEEGMVNDSAPSPPSGGASGPEICKVIYPVNPAKQFDASINWLLDSVEALVDRKRSS